MTRYHVLWLLLVAGCQGLSSQGNPPDPSVAASATWGVQSVNEFPMIAGNLDTTQGVGLGNLGAQTDRRIYWDQFAQRWLSVGLINAGYPQETVGCSAGPDPTGPWYLYTYVPTNTPDMPSMGMAQNIAIVTDRSGQQFFAQTITNLQFGVGGTPWVFPTLPEACAARSRDGDLAFNYVVAAGGSGNSTINIQRLSQDLTLRQARIDTPTFGTGGIRIGALNMGDPAVNHGYNLTQSPQDAYVGAGGRHLYVVVDVAHGADSCLRIMDFADVAASPFAPTLQGSQDFCLSGADVWEGALAQNIDGTLYLVAHCSGPALPISMCYAVWTGPGGSPPVFIKKYGTAFSNLYRVGDYATAQPWWRDGGHKILATTEIGFAQSQPYAAQTWIDLIP